MKIVGWTVIGAMTGIVVGLVWHRFEPSLALYFWPVFGAVIFGQHAYRSHRDKGDKGDRDDRDDRGRAGPPATRDGE
jgi:hypothetical protein